MQYVLIFSLQAESMLRGRVCFSQGTLKALLLHMIPRQKCLEGVSCCFCGLPGLWLHGMPCSGTHNALHPKGASLWDWLLGTARSSHCTHSMPHSQLLLLRIFRIPLCILCSGSGWRAACPSVQFRAAFPAEHSHWATVGDSSASSAWCLQRTNIVCLCGWPPKAYSFCQLFFPFWILTFYCYLTL